MTSNSIARVSLTLVFSALIVACGGDASNDRLFSEQTSVTAQVSIELFKDTQLTVPFSDEFTVVVHGNDSQSNEQVLVLSEEGSADLGLFTDTLSVTLAYRYPIRLITGSDIQELDQVALRSYLDLPLSDIQQEDGRYVLRLPAEGAFTVVDVVARNLTVTVDAPVLPQTQSSTSVSYVSKLQPLPTFNSRTDCSTSVRGGQALHLGVDLFSTQAQADGTFSVLSLITKRTDSEIQRYGFLLDHSPDDGEDISINANRFPELIVVDSTAFPIRLPDGSDRASNLSGLEIRGQRSGVSYLLSNRLVAWQELPDLSGGFSIVDCNTSRSMEFPATLKVATEFPVDDYVVEQTTNSFIRVGQPPVQATQSSSLNVIRNSCVHTQRMEQLPSQIIIEPPTMSYSDLNYDQTQRVFNWTNQAPSRLRSQSIGLFFESEFIFATENWSIYMSDNRSSLALPELPDELWQQLNLSMDAIDRIKIRGFDYSAPLADVTTVDFAKTFLASSSTECSREIPVLSQEN